jgi:FGGY family of carbohydrate kinases, N-terminal domain
VSSYVLAIDQGTTSTRAILFRADTSIASFAQRELPQHFPADGEVEHEPEDLWSTTLETARSAVRNAGASAKDIVAIGIANQGETALVWHRATGRPMHRAIVWQDRRTTDLCARLKAEGHEAAFSAKTGLLLDPYFSGTKVAWLLQKDAANPALAAHGELAFGTVDSYLLWRLTGGNRAAAKSRQKCKHRQVRVSAPRRAQLFRPHSPWANATTAATRCCVRSKSNDAAPSSAAAYTQRRLSYCAFFRNDPAPRAIALTVSMPEAFTDFNRAHRMRPHRERSVCISSLGVAHGRSRSGRAAIKNVPQCRRRKAP